MPDTEFIEDTGIVDRDIGDNEVSRHQQAKDVFAKITRLGNTDSCHSGYPGCVDCRLNQDSFDSVEVIRCVHSERPNNTHSATTVRLTPYIYCPNRYRLLLLSSL